MTGNSVSRSNSVEFAPVHAGDVARELADRDLHAQADAQVRDLAARARPATARILPSIPRPPKPPGTRMPSASARRSRGRLVGVERLGVDPVDLDPAAVQEARVAQRLDDGQVGVLELDVLADERDPHRLRRRRRRAR